MSEDTKPPDNVKQRLGTDDVYLRIWEQQQESVRQRWNIIIFFLSVSFAIFGLSIRERGLPIAGTIQRTAAVAIYWFSYLVYVQYSAWSKFLRSYLEELENTSSTTITIQTKWKGMRGTHRWLTVKKLLLYFGLLYTIAVIVLWWAGV